MIIFSYNSLISYISFFKLKISPKILTNIKYQYQFPSKLPSYSIFEQYNNNLVSFLPQISPLLFQISITNNKSLPPSLLETLCERSEILAILHKRSEFFSSEGNKRNGEGEEEAHAGSHQAFVKTEDRSSRITTPFLAGNRRRSNNAKRFRDNTKDIPTISFVPGPIISTDRDLHFDIKVCSSWFHIHPAPLGQCLRHSEFLPRFRSPESLDAINPPLSFQRYLILRDKRGWWPPPPPPPPFDFTWTFVSRVSSTSSRKKERFFFMDFRYCEFDMASETSSFSCLHVRSRASFQVVSFL